MKEGYIAFPGLGIEPFHIDNIAFEVFGRGIAWYGILIAVGMLLAYFYALRRAKYEGLKSDDLTDFALYMIIFGVIGARLYYVLFYTEGNYLVTGKGFFGNLWGTLYNMISVWNGGLAIYGGIIAGIITIMTVARIKKVRLPLILDVVAPGVMIGQIIGRWGNFINIEAYGALTDLPWRMRIVEERFTSPHYGEVIDVHPTFLYESLWNLVGFILISCLYKKKRYHGEVFLWYITWYGLGRMLIEGLRTDSLMLGPLRISQCIAAVTFVCGLAALTVGQVRHGKRKASGEKLATAGESTLDLADDAEEDNVEAGENGSEAESEETTDSTNGNETGD